MAFIDENNIITPDDICTFKIDLKSKQTDKTSIFSEILKNIRNMHPFFKTYKEENIFDIISEKEGNKKYIKYEFNKIITYTDFNGVENTKRETIESGRYLETNISPKYITVKREKTKEMRQQFWMWRWLPCFKDEYLINYYTIKTYDISGNIYKLRDFLTSDFQSDDNKGEDYRRKLESELSRNIDRKL